jgi:dipeptidyl-peptidase-4
MHTGTATDRSVVERTLRILTLALILLPLLQATPAEAQRQRVNQANYALAERFSPPNMRTMVFSTSVRTNWLEHSDRFWYAWETQAGRIFYLVDPARKTKTPVFDPVWMAAELSHQTRDPYDAAHLPIRSIEFVKEDRAIQFSVQTTKPAEPDTAQKGKVIRPKQVDLRFEYDLAARRLTLLEDWEEEPDAPRWASIAPDSSVVVFAREHNLFLMSWADFVKIRDKEDTTDVVEHQLTEDGEEDYSFASGSGRSNTQQEERRQEGERQSAGRLVWSRDSSKFATIRSDRRKVKDLWVINSLSDPRPTLETYKYDMPGEENVTQYEMWVFDVASRGKVRIDIDEFKDQSVSILTQRRRQGDPPASIWLGGDAGQIWFERQSRDMHQGDVCVADTGTGEARVVIAERLNTYIETQRPELINNGTEIVWWSERDGWGHYYLYGTDGTLKRQITRGPFNCRGVEVVDERNRVLYFEATGREAGEDPYYRHLYRIGLDGTGMQLLSPGDFNHSTSLDEDGRWFVDNYSRVDTTPQAALFDTRGQKLLDLEEADLSLLFEAGYRFPEPYRVKADDGITDLYGVIYKPFDFDENRQYPIIAYVYPGPQTESVDKSFSTNAQNVSLAQAGFIVITVGNRGGHPERSKWYHNYGYGNLRDYGLADKKAAIEQLAARHPWIDIDRVGIFGHSGGGFMSTAAMLIYPDFFKVAVSSSGNHENNVYNKPWSEKHHGVTEIINREGEIDFEYEIDKNSEIAANLKGHLLITTGDIDNNVHPANTLRLANALIRANKRFDMFVFPGQRHGYGDMGDYWHYLRLDYFAKYLLGDFSQPVDMLQVRRQQEADQRQGRRGR